MNKKKKERETRIKTAAFLAGASAGTSPGATPNSPAATPAPANQQTTPPAPTADSQINAALNT